MKNKFFSFMILAGIFTLVFSPGCKKNTPTQIGDWKLSNINGKILTTTTPSTSNDTFITTYDNAGKIKTEIDNSGAPDSYPYTLELNIKSDGSLVVSETRTQNNQYYNPTFTGTWTLTGTTVVLNGFENTDFYGDFNSKTFQESNITSNSMTLTYNNTTTTGVTTVVTSYTITLSK
jgi:hypothetical protein